LIDVETLITADYPIRTIKRMCDEVLAAMNEDTWEHLEDYCRQLALDHHHLYIVAGPLGEGGEGLIKPTTIKHAAHIGRSNVVVPTYTWKVILVVNDAPGDDVKKVDADTRLIAVMMPNNQTLDLDWTKFRVSVHEVEQKTGLRFFTAVPATIIEPLKLKIDSAPIVAGYVHQ
jgi:endonuclease G